MQLDSVSDGLSNYPGWKPQLLEAIAPTYLSAVKPRQRLDGYRCRAGR
jgi:NADH dehydrogenase